MYIKNKHIYVLLGIVILGIAFMTVNGMRKTGLYYIDEQWSFSVANSKERFFLYDLHDSWLMAEDLRSYLTVQSDQRFSYDIPYNNSTQDAHPPLYFLLLHTVCSFFPNTLSKWYGLSINIVFYALTIGVVYILAHSLFCSKNKALLAVVIWAFSTGTVSSVMLVRMYMMLTFFSTLTLFFVIKYFIENKRIYLWSVFVVSFLGGLTEYTFWIFAFFMMLMFFVMSLKNWREYLSLGMTWLISFAVVCYVFPQTILQIMRPSLNTSRFDSLIVLERYVDFKKIWDWFLYDFKGAFPIIYISGKFLIVLALFFFSIYIWAYVRSRKKVKFRERIKNISPESLAFLIMFFSSVMCAYFVEAVRPFYDVPGNRYLHFLYPSEAIIVTWVWVGIYSILTNMNMMFRRLSYCFLAIAFVTLNGPLKFNESWFIHEDTREIEDFNDRIAKSYVFLLFNSQPFHYVTHTLPYTFDIVRAIYPIDVSQEQSKAGYDSRRIIINQIQKHIPIDEKIIILRHLEPSSHRLINDENFISLLHANGLELNMRNVNIGLSGAFTVYEVTRQPYDYYSTKETRLRSIATDIYEYPDFINDPRYSVLIGVRDETAVSLNDDITARLSALGLEISLKGKIQHSYLAVIDKRKVIHENIGQDKNEAISHNGTLSDGTSFGIYSASSPAGNDCSIVIDGVEYAANYRGLNIVVYDNIKKKVIDSVAFDTWSRGLEANRKNNLLQMR